MSNSIWRKGVQFWALPLNKEIWQIALFTIGHERWTNDDEDHQEPEFITWYLQFFMFQISHTRELS